MKIIFTIILTSIYVTGQIKDQTLFELSRSFDSLDQLNTQEALIKAQTKGWPIKGKRNGRSFELEKLSESGMPIYNVTENLNSARTISTYQVWPGGGSQTFLTGQGMTVGIWDNGKVRDTHQELIGRVQQMDGDTELGDHATHVGGTMIASGYINNAKGMAFQAQLDAYNWNNDESEMATAANNGLRISNHSYGTFLGWYWDYFDDDRWAWFGDVDVDSSEDYRFGFYSNSTKEWDEIAYNAPYYMIVISAGNEREDEPSNTGTEHWVYSPADGDWVLSTTVRDGDGPWDCLGDKKVAKNIFTVGAVEDIAGGYEYPSQVQLTSFSSVGPMDDGRIKPDIVANGAGLYSSLEENDSDYGSYWGTSMAAPSVSGSLTLVLQHVEANMDTTIQAATLKGLAIHTADEAGSHEGPDYKYGWGLMNTQRAVELVSSIGDGHEIVEDELAYEDSIDYEFASLGADPFRATLSWSDPPGNPPSASLDPSDIMLVHDLDIRVIDPIGNTHFPYKLNKYDPSAAAFTGDNVVDNVEQIHISQTISGSYTVRVKHKGVLNNDQTFGLIVSYGSSIPETIHVAPNGNDSNADGSINNPFATIQAALDFSGMGDTIIVGEGTYIENIEMENQNNVIASHFILNGDSSVIENTVIDGNGNGNVITMHYTGQSTELVGFTIQNGYTTDGGAGLYCENSFPTISHCIFQNNQSGISDPYTHGGAMLVKDSEISLENVIFRSNYSSGQGGGLYLDQSTIEGSQLLFHSNKSNVKGGSIGLYKSTGNVEHVTFTNDSAVTEGGALFLHESELTVTSSILWQNCPEQIAFSSTGDGSIVNINYSILDEYISGVTTNDNGTLNFGLFDVFDTDPLFCEPDSMNFTLADNSPCIGLGEDDTNAGYFDIGCSEIVSIHNEIAPMGFTLNSPYPNPFNALTTIQYTINEASNEPSLLRVINVNGREVDVLINEKIEPGSHEVKWNALSFSSGVYFIQLIHGEKSSVQKMIYLK